MNSLNPKESRSRIHPLVATAAGAVILACGVGVAAMTGILPKAGGTTEPTPAPAAMTTASNNITPPSTASVAPRIAEQAPPPPPPQQIAQNAPPPPAPAPAVCSTCGVVTSVNEFRTEGHGTGIGAAGGAVAGGLVGHAFGGGNGRVATTLLGALGGGLAGNSIERHVRSTTSYRVYVRMQDGRVRYFTYANPPPVSQGSHVRVVNGVLHTG